MSRYAAKLLFEFDKCLHGVSAQKRRVCESKIVIFHANSDDEVYESALTYGKESQYSYTNKSYDIHYHFIGITELISLGSESEENEVWWQFEEKLSPRERADKLIPKKHQLRLFQEISGKGKIKL
jgi:hypothetical protein